jgi:membrane-bound lytic murein transglycosylase B
MSRPAEAKPWHEYRSIFLTEPRIAGGAAFWAEHAATLERAESAYGIAAKYIVAIIGVETFYGRHEGKTRVLDSLATLAFRYPRRQEFFARELEQFILLTREEGLDARSLKGSYAGAMGIPQFIASSYRAYAVDFDGDRVRDLIGSPVDAIGSVANYLGEHGWRRHEEVVFPVRVSGAGYRSLLAKGLEPKTTLRAMAEQGVIIDADGADASRLGALVELDLRDGHEYWVGLKNFYAITRYNRSELYAMAVAQLAESIEQRYRRTP